MQLPKLKQYTAKNVTMDTFGGLNQRITAAENELTEMRNLSSEYYPMLCTREHRATIAQLRDPTALTERDAPCWIEGGKVWYNHYEVPGLRITGTEPRQLISMGAYVLIWPDRKYFNTVDLTDSGSIDAVHEATLNSAQPLILTMTDLQGAEYNVNYIQAEEPENPQNGEYWIDTSDSLHVLAQYSSAQGAWVQVATVYVKLSRANIGKAFERGDGIILSGLDLVGDNGAQVRALNGSHVIQEKGDDYVVIIGIIDLQATLAEGTVKLERKAPDMDYLTEAGNRVWGCKYGFAGGTVVNELYCCKLGDFKNWQVYSGISTDSWAASRGGDGAWTGAGTLGSYPVFFRENSIEMIYPSSQGAHQVSVIEAQGAAKGSWRSIVTAGNVMYYLSPGGVCVFNGSRPSNISDKLTYRLHEGRAGFINKKYYLSAADERDNWHLLVYDSHNLMWHEEDATKALMFARVDDDLYYIDESTGKLISELGFNGDDPEGAFHWECVLGITGRDTEKQKKLQRFAIRGKLPGASTLQVWIEYDDSGIWEKMADIHGHGLRSWLLPIRPRRCDTARIKLTGMGDALIMALHKDYMKASDFVGEEE